MIQDTEESINYENCTIRNIRRGTGVRAKYIYARLMDSKGNLVISATLDYIVKSLEQRLPNTHNETDKPKRN